MAVQLKVGQFLAPAVTGNQNVSWSNADQWPASATPQIVIFFATGQTAAGTVVHAGSALGAFNATQQLSFSSFADGGTTITTMNTGQSTRTTVALVILGNGNPDAILGVAAPGTTRFASNQFSLNWTTASASSNGIVIGYMALSGLSETWMGALRMPTANGSQPTPVLGSGAQWDAGIFFPTWHTTAVGSLADPATTTMTTSRTGIGFAARNGASIEQYANILYDTDAQGTVEAALGNSSTRCMLVPVFNANFAAGSHMQEAELTAFGTDGKLTFNWTIVNNWADKALLAILMRGVAGRVGVTLQPNVTTSGTDVAVSGIGVQPKGVLLTSSGQTATGSVTATLPNNGTAEWAFGASDGTTHRAITNINQDGALESEARRTLATTKAITTQKYNAADASNALTPVVTSGEATVQSLDATGFTLDWIGQDATQRRVGYLALGDEAAGVTPINASDTHQLALTESVTLERASTRTDTHTLALTETAAVARASEVADTHTLGATDTASVLIVLELAAADTHALATTESTALALTSTATDTHALSVTDSASVVVTAVNLAAADTHAIAATEASALVSTATAADMHVLTGTDATTLARASTVTDTHAVEVTEGVSLARTSVVADTQTLTSTDAGTVSIVETKAAADTHALALTDVAGLITVDAKAVSDSHVLGFSDIAAVERSDTRAAADTHALAVSEAANVVVMLTTAEDPTVAVFDAAAMAATLTVAETPLLTATEVAALSAMLTAAEASVIGLTESALAVDASITPIVGFTAVASGTFAATASSTAFVATASTREFEGETA
jgi:hypothetical protein